MHGHFQLGPTLPQTLNCLNLRPLWAWRVHISVQTQIRSVKVSALLSCWFVREKEDNRSVTHIWDWHRQTGRVSLCIEGYSWFQVEEGEKNRVGCEGGWSWDHYLTHDIYLQTFLKPNVTRKEPKSLNLRQEEESDLMRSAMIPDREEQYKFIIHSCRKRSALLSQFLSDTVWAESESNNTLESPGRHQSVQSTVVSKQCVLLLSETLFA